MKDFLLGAKTNMMIDHLHHLRERHFCSADWTVPKRLEKLVAEYDEDDVSAVVVFVVGARLKEMPLRLGASMNLLTRIFECRTPEDSANNKLNLVSA